MPRSPDRIRRFSAGERWIHLSLGTLLGICMLTAAVLYVDPLSALVGRRAAVETVHLVSGLLVPVPLVVGGVCSRAFRDDVRRLNRFHSGDWQWLRSRHRREGWLPSGKFNAGQKLNAAFVLGAVLVLFATGLMLASFDLFADWIRTGATFVHDAFAAVLVVITTGHVVMAWRFPEARRGLRTGYVERGWAEREHALWAAEVADAPPGDGDG